MQIWYLPKSSLKPPEKDFSSFPKSWHTSDSQETLLRHYQHELNTASNFTWWERNQSPSRINDSQDSQEKRTWWEERSPRIILISVRIMRCSAGLRSFWCVLIEIYNIIMAAIDVCLGLSLLYVFASTSTSLAALSWLKEGQTGRTAVAVSPARGGRRHQQMRQKKKHNKIEWIWMVWLWQWVVLEQTAQQPTLY